MEWTQFAIFFIGVFGLFIWNRTESRNDIRHMDSKLEANRELVRSIHDESKAMISAIQTEMKDFHYKLLDLEKKKMG
jgi:hypothetical protein